MWLTGKKDHLQVLDMPSQISRKWFQMKENIHFLKKGRYIYDVYEFTKCTKEILILQINIYSLFQFFLYFGNFGVNCCRFWAVGLSFDSNKWTENKKREREYFVYHKKT